MRNTIYAYNKGVVYMANDLVMTPLMDVEMISLRRSGRIAKIQQDKQSATIKQGEEQKVKKPRKTNPTKTKKEIKPQQVIKKKQAVKRTRKNAIDMLLNAQDMSQIKINHLFTLVKRYCPFEERSFKYSILQTILKSYKQIGIQNTLHDLSTHMPKVVQYLSMQYNIIAVQDALDSMFAFPELMLQSKTPQKIQPYGLDDLVGMMASTCITDSTQGTICNTQEDDLSALFKRCSLL